MRQHLGPARRGAPCYTSRLNHEDVKPDDLLVVSWEGGKLRGERVPTSETELHRQILLERPGLGAIIHSRSAYAKDSTPPSKRPLFA